MGENNFNYTFSFYDRWVVRYIPLFSVFFLSYDLSFKIINDLYHDHSFSYKCDNQLISKQVVQDAIQCQHPT